MPAGILYLRGLFWNDPFRSHATAILWLWPTTGSLDL